MTGTDSTRPGLSGRRVVILVRPQLPENIGMAVRAMLNCGLTRLRLVRPREIWPPNDKAVAAVSGADGVIEDAALFASRTGWRGLVHVYATTARLRYMT